MFNGDKMSEMYLKCLAFAAEKHDGQRRATGESYISHPVAVAGILEAKGYENDNYMAVALLHDVLEDTDCKVQEIIDLTCDTWLAERVVNLTKEKNYDMEEYISRFYFDGIAKLVKLADRIHNLRTAIMMPLKFRERYIKETEQYYIKLSEGSVFEIDIKVALNRLKETLPKTQMERILEGEYQ